MSTTVSLHFLLNIGNLQNMSSWTFLLSQKFSRKKQWIKLPHKTSLVRQDFLYKWKDGELYWSPIFTGDVHYGKEKDGIGIPHWFGTSKSSKHMVVESHYFCSSFHHDQENHKNYQMKSKLFGKSNVVVEQNKLPFGDPCLFYWIEPRVVTYA